MTVPKIVAVDFETERNGLGDLEYWAPGFKITCAAFSWLNGGDNPPSSVWGSSQQAVYPILAKLAEQQIPLLAHNVAFEQGVCKALFPSLDLNWSVDTMRLVALYDGGVDRNATDSVDELLAGESDTHVEKKTGLGLKDSIRRILPQYSEQYYEPFDWIMTNIPEARIETRAQYLPRLPQHLLEKYNVADTTLSLYLYSHISDYFQRINYDWSVDHALFLNSVRLITDAKLRGIKVDVDGLRQYRQTVSEELTNIEEKFKIANASYITQLEDKMLVELQSKYKTERGRLAAVAPKFNIGSKSQLGTLFCDIMHHDAIFKTPTGKPSCRSAHLKQFGETGQMLETRGTRMIALQQTDKLLEKAAIDGRYHVDLRTCGTITGRFSGSGGLNVQGLSRRDEGFMSKLIADPGQIFISIDFSAGEPTVTTELSGDRNYRRAVFDMVGEKPYWEGPTLIIDDLYLMTASVSPTGAKAMREAYARPWGMKTFQQQWLADPEVIKKALKPVRQFHKTMCLAVGYGCGARKLSRYAYEKGFTLSLAEARMFIDQYWKLFPEVKRLFDKMDYQVQKHGWFTNMFGYRLVPQESRKAGNYLIQSSVSGLMNLLCLKLFEEVPWARYLTTIHDEILVSVPEMRLEEFKEIKEKVVQQLNEELQWSIAVRAGFAAGRTFYEAK